MTGPGNSDSNSRPILRSALVSILLLFFGAIVVFTRLTTIGSAAPDSATETTETAATKAPLEVEAQPLKVGHLPVSIACQGQIQLNSHSVQTLSPQIAATIVEVLCQEGQRVQKGDVLFRLDDRLTRGAEEKARAAMTEAQTELAKFDSSTSGVASQDLHLAHIEAQAAYDQAQKATQRDLTLNKGHFVSPELVEEANRTTALAAQQLLTARYKAENFETSGKSAERALLTARVEQATAEFHNATINTSSTIVRADQNGIVHDLSGYPGLYVDTTTVLGKIMDASPEGRECILSVPVEEAGRIHPGQSAYFRRLQTGERSVETKYPWTIATEAGGTMSNGATVLIRATPSTPVAAKAFLPGEFMMAEILTSEDGGEETLLAPSTALVPEGNPGEYALYVIDEKGSAHKQHVKVVARDGTEWGPHETVAIQAAGLKEGQLVVTTGAYNLPDGTQVKVRDKATGL